MPTWRRTGNLWETTTPREPLRYASILYFRYKTSTYSYLFIKLTKTNPQLIID